MDRGMLAACRNMLKYRSIRHLNRSPMSRAAKLTLGLAAAELLLAASALAQSKCQINGQDVPCEQLGESVKGAVGLGLAFVAVMAIFGLLTTVFWVMMIVHAATHDVENKPVWIILMVLTGVVGAIIYYIAVKRKMGAAPAAMTAPASAMPQPGAETPPPPQLVEYVKTSLAAGQGKDQIRQTLVAAGWNPNDVERALR